MPSMKPRADLRVASLNFLQFGLPAFHVAVEGDDVEQIAVVQMVEHELSRPLGLLDLFAAHAARAIDDEHDRLWERLFMGRFDRRAGQHEKIAVVAGMASIAQDGRPDLPLTDVIEQAEVRGGNLILGLIGDDGMFVVGTLDIDRLGGAVDVLDFRLAFDRHVELDLLDRLRGVFGGAQRKEKVGQPLGLAAELRIAQRHLALGPRRHREDARLEQPRPQPLEQRRIAILADDLFIKMPGLLGGQELGRILLAVDHQRQLVDRAVIRERKNEADFHRPAAGINERLRDLHAGHLVDANLR